MIEDRSTDGDIAFVVRDGDAMLTEYGTSHTKEMHLIVVRDDLQHFQHLHPQRDGEGVWHVAFTPAAGGTYWMYADFVAANGTSHTIRFEKTYAGEMGAYGVVKNAERVKTISGYTIQLPSVPTLQGKTLSFVYFITDAQGKTVPVEEYLGAMGHSVLISPSGDFIHAHAIESEFGDPEFLVPLPKEKFYRAFTQLQIKGKVIVVDFDWDERV